MRTYLVDGSNAVRRHGYDPRFPAVEERRTLAWLERIDRLAESASGRPLSHGGGGTPSPETPGSGRFQVEVFFDGRPRDVGGPYASLRVRFSAESQADDMIMGVVRLLGFSGRGAVVVTEDGALADEARSEGARVLRFCEFEERLRSRKA